MASQIAIAVNDTPVSIKITIAGSEEHKKFRLSLKDLGANTLPDKLREHLGVGPLQSTTFQRYSDSSTSWVALDSNEPSVYKQLYRAAKAKGRLRLRVTIVDLQSTTPPQSPERLPKRSYVKPYVSDVGADQNLSSRISMLEDFKAFSATLPVLHSVPTPPKAAEPKSDANTHFWPITHDGMFSDKTKAQFERQAFEPNNDAAAANYLPQGSSVGATLPNEAPVPGFFDFSDEHSFGATRPPYPTLNSQIKQSAGRPSFARDHCMAKTADHKRDSCLAKLANIQQKAVNDRQAAALNTHANFVIWCNQCDNAIADEHWHCGICDGGDYDICLKCADKGAMCSDEQHWLIKRFHREAKIITSTTETLAPKKPSKADVKKEDIPGAYKAELKVDQTPQPQRTCNACVQVLAEREFITCTACDDYDLCKACFTAEEHGHHPAHRFEAAVKDVKINTATKNLLAPGRHFSHHALCDGCDKAIVGVRHKCLDCPDWDFCDICALSAPEIHPGHRLAPFYEAIAPRAYTSVKHFGVYCDGPLCTGAQYPIKGDRYKCAVCHDTDFCSRCEALPTLDHNQTHPLLKFKTSIRNVSVSTYGEKANGEAMTPMGDQPPSTSSKSTATTPAAHFTNAATQVQSEAEASVKKEKADSVKSEKPPTAAHALPSLNAQFMYDTVSDGTVVEPSSLVSQTWTLHNPGPGSWPAGCSVSFVGGDGMFNVDPYHPISVSQINMASITNATDREVMQGENFDFTVTLRMPERQGKAVSYWRLKASEGTPFGHKLWCEVDVRKSKATKESKSNVSAPNSVLDIAPPKREPASRLESNAEASQEQGSRMIFPRLEKESPLSSCHAAENAQVDAAAEPNKAALSPAEQDLLEDVESLELDDCDDASSDEDGFLTDEEYELIASSDEIEALKNGKA